jgi:hypothetical protein
VRSCSGAPLFVALLFLFRKEPACVSRPRALACSSTEANVIFFPAHDIFRTATWQQVSVENEKKLQRSFKEGSKKESRGIGRKRVTKRAFGDNICHESTFGDFKKIFFS